MFGSVYEGLQLQNWTHSCLITCDCANCVLYCITVFVITDKDNASFVAKYCKYLAAYMDLERANMSETCRSCSCLKPAAEYDPYLCYLNKHPYITLAYDALWALALALSAAEKNLTTNFPPLSLANFSYHNPIITDAIFSAFQQNNFIGVSVSWSHFSAK